MQQPRMRRSRVLEKLRAGEVVSCFKLNIDSARSAEVAALSGFDCLWTDNEHTAMDWTSIESQIWVTKGYDTDIIVRVSRGGYSDYIRPLELDATGIMVPHIMSLDDAKSVVRMTRFQPLGRRPVDSTNADGAYANIELLEYLQRANEQRFVAVQIEDPEPLDDLDAIAALPGIDIIFFGPVDFSHALGAPGDFQHPVLLETRRRIAEVCRANGKWAGTIANPGNLHELIDLGYRFLSIGADVTGLGLYCRQMLAAFDKDNNGELPASKSNY